MQGSAAKQSILSSADGGWIFLVDKASGWTSFDVVARLRRITGEERIGHAGALDPSATGLLIVAAGEAASNLIEGLEGSKTYEADIRLGVASSTWDWDASWKLEAAVPEPDWNEIDTAIQRLAGRNVQIPPMVAAIKRRGAPLYKVARQGWWLEREPRETRIDLIRLTGIERIEETSRIRLEVECGGGVYVRSIAHDLGEMLGVPASLEKLRRTRVGARSVEDAALIEEIEKEWVEIQNGNSDEGLSPRHG